MKIETGKYYKTRGGYKAKIYEVYDDKIHGAIWLGEQWNVIVWNREGCYNPTIANDPDGIISDRCNY